MSNYNLVLYCKSYSGDLERLKNLTESIEKHNKDNIPFYVSVPHKEQTLFQKELPSWVNLIDDEQVYYSPVKGIQGWKQQQYVKARFYLTGISRYYVSIDSDSYFFKDFYIHDFMFTEEIPYMVMHKGVSLHEWFDRFEELFPFDMRRTNEEEYHSIKQHLDSGGPHWDFSPSPFVWDTKVWQWLDKEYNIEKLFQKHTNELKWYGEGAIKMGAEFWPTEPLFACMHYPQQYQYYKQLGWEEKHFHKQYLGMVMQSNWGAPVKF